MSKHTLSVLVENKPGVLAARSPKRSAGQGGRSRRRRRPLNRSEE
jgi:hypothetical protein